jgi:hypothetical protein
MCYAHVKSIDDLKDENDEHFCSAADELGRVSLQTATMKRKESRISLLDCTAAEQEKHVRKISNNYMWGLRSFVLLCEEVEKGTIELPSLDTALSANDSSDHLCSIIGTARLHSNGIFASPDSPTMTDRC